MWLLSLVLVCSSPQESVGPASTTPVNSTPEIAEASPPVEAAACAEVVEDRLEGPEAAGECTQDADCQAAGCSGEVCVTVASAADVMTLCEVLPCQAVLEACRCQDTLCRWTLRSSEAPPQSPAGPPVAPP
jgi:eight-cysteine-cluster-containing protein